ncbi:hypothetical protein JKP88DRAFT_335895 [Tribonema minus]|uniref:TRAF-type domain-containing protein n=1 Tax=Tribonema minus TaxID=303371 RepID=A0A835YKF8_9STRA|nr:hypothetical protein JKP88DRAFT_335895 [Tribonema minus]
MTVDAAAEQAPTPRDKQQQQLTVWRQGKVSSHVQQLWSAARIPLLLSGLTRHRADPEDNLHAASPPAHAYSSERGDDKRRLGPVRQTSYTLGKTSRARAKPLHEWAGPKPGAAAGQATGQGNLLNSSSGVSAVTAVTTHTTATASAASTHLPVALPSPFSGDKDLARLCVPLPRLADNAANSGAATFGHAPGSPLRSLAYPSGVVMLFPPPPEQPSQGRIATGSWAAPDQAEPQVNDTLERSDDIMADITPDAEEVCERCGSGIPAPLMRAHVRSSCRLLPCDACAALLLPRDHARHSHTDCSRRPVPCARCGARINAQQYAQHSAQECPARPVRCAACNEFVTARDLSAHAATRCAQRAVPCPLGCGAAVRAAAAAAEHCCGAAPPWRCACGAAVTLSARAAHLASCEAFLDAWEGALERLRRGRSRAALARAVVRLARGVGCGAAAAAAALAEAEGDAGAAHVRLEGAGYRAEIEAVAGMVNVGRLLKGLRRKGGRAAVWQVEGDDDDAISDPEEAPLVEGRAQQGGVEGEHGTAQQGLGGQRSTAGCDIVHHQTGDEEHASRQAVGEDEPQ